MRIIKNKTVLSSSYWVKNDCTFDKNGKMFEGYIASIEAFSVMDSSDTSTDRVKFHIKMKGEDSETIIESTLKGATNKNVVKLFNDKRIFSYCSDYKFAKYINDSVKFTIGHQKLPTNFLIEQGAYITPDEKPVYVFGDKKLNSTDDDPIISDSKLKLAYDYDASDKEISDYLDTLINATGFPSAALIVVLAAFVIPLIKSTSDSLAFIGYLYGPSGIGKTSIAKLILDIFRNHDNMALLISDIDKLIELIGKMGFPCLIDDYMKTCSESLNNSNGKKSTELFHLTSSGGSCKTSKYSINNDHIFFVTAENVVPDISSTNRCLLIYIDTPFDSNQMTYLTSKKYIYISFLTRFIEWLYHNSLSILADINYYKSRNRKDEKKYSDKYIGFKRILSTNQTLGVTLDFFKRFMKESLHMSEERTDDLYKKCRESIDSCIQDTFDHCLKDPNEINREFVDVILNEIYYPEHIVTSDYQEYKTERKKAKKEKRIPKYVFYFDGASLHAEPTILVKWLKTIPGLESIPTEQKVIKQLDDHRFLLKTGGRFRTNISEDNNHTYIHMPIASVKAAECKRCNINDIHYDWDFTTHKEYGKWNIDSNDDDYDDYDDLDYNNDYYDDDDFS